MPTYKGIRCSVIVESRKLDEYEDKKSGDANNPDVITRYIDIDGTKGHNFVIEVEALPDFSWDPSFTAVGCDCHVDNQLLTYSPTISQDDPVAKIEGSKYAQDVDGEEVEFTEEMFFSEFNIVTEGSELGTNTISDSTDPRLQSIGRIEVSLRRCTWVGDSSAPLACAYNPSEISISQAIKGKAPIHTVQMGPAKQIPKGSWGKYDDLDTDAPFILFVFLYRTHTYLDNMGIIPYIPFHSELPIVIRDEDDSLKTREELMAEVQALRSRLIGRGTPSGSRNLKRERSNERVKAENNSKKAKGSVTESTQDNNEIIIIDLTGDE